MGKILIPGGGGGADLDVITATAPDVRKNKVIVDKDGEPLAGAMNEQAGGTFTPGTSDRVLVPANTFVTSAIIMKGDPNLIAGNIKRMCRYLGLSEVMTVTLYRQITCINTGAMLLDSIEIVVQSRLNPMQYTYLRAALE